MADVVILGAGVAGHTAALHLSRLLPRGHTVTVVSPELAVELDPEQHLGRGRAR